MSLFSESMNLELSDIHLILGPSQDYMSMDEDFSNDPKQCFYDLKDQLKNIEMMHEIVEKTRQPYLREIRKKKEKEKQERKLKRAK